MMMSSLLVGRKVRLTPSIWKPQSADERDRHGRDDLPPVTLRNAMSTFDNAFMPTDDSMPGVK